MADSMRDIKRRIKSVTSTKQITHAMQLVASAKLRNARMKADARREYTNYVIETMHMIAGALEREEPNAFLKANDCKKDLYIVVTSDKGLAGGFNSGLLKFTAEAMNRSEEVAVMVSGAKGLDYFKRRNYEILGSYIGNSDEADFGTASRIGKAVTTLFLDGKVGNVYIMYNRFVSVISQKPTMIKLLPLSREELASKEDEIDTETAVGEYRPESGIFGTETAKNMIFEPSAEYLANMLIPSYIDNAVYGALLESAAGELASRRMAMENATDNADEIIADLSLAYNRARQGAITQEITEIVSGANAIG
ncbi:MAG: ATP synthase F1 subunit gamma [Oscillospiraceae bacterium]|nr:ATP synthase F1 subunit gamma [Oscillospiraceae bacterium]